MAKNILYRGSDTEFTITLRDSSGNLLNIETLAGLIIIVYSNKNNTEVGKYSLNTLAGYKPITVVSTGVVKCYLEASQTSTAPLGDLFIETKIKFSNGAYENNDFETIDRKAYLLTIEDSITKTLTGY